MHCGSGQLVTCIHIHTNDEGANRGSKIPWMLKLPRSTRRGVVEKTITTALPSRTIEFNRISAQALKLITIAFLLSFAFCCLNANLFVVFFKGRQIFASLAELPFFHTFSNIPVDKSTLAVHKVELVINARENLCNGRRVADHTASTHYLRQVASRNDCWWLVIDATFETSWTPVNELNCSFRLDSCYGCIYIF